MINRSTWQAVRDAMIAGDRAKLGPPPTVDEILAYERGELSEEHAARVQQLLIAYPDLARAYATPFPSDDAEPLPDEVIDRQWKAFRNAGRPNGRVLQFWRRFSAIAATAAIVFSAMLWQQHAERLQPHVLPEPHVLTPDGRRSLSEQHYTITAKGDSVLLVVSLIGPTDYERYRLEVVNSESHEHIWSSESLRVTDSGSFDLEIPSRILAPGTYQVIAYGLRDNAKEQVATYTFEVRR